MNTKIEVYNPQKIVVTDIINNLILYLANNITIPAGWYTFKDTDLFRINEEINLSEKDAAENFFYFCDALHAMNYLRVYDNNNPAPSSSTSKRFGLTPKGWERFDEINRERSVDTKLGFMAMPFSNAEIRKLYEAFKLEVQKAGFILENPLLHRPSAGNIDARLEVELRKARFIIADLTDDNSNVYWEAGFAHGLGKPVFYTCKKDSEIKFDVNHHQIIFWESNKITEAAENLKNIIRNTFPKEACLDD